MVNNYFADKDIRNDDNNSNKRADGGEQDGKAFPKTKGMKFTNRPGGDVKKGGLGKTDFPDRVKKL